MTKAKGIFFFIAGLLLGFSCLACFLVLFVMSLFGLPTSVSGWVAFIELVVVFAVAGFLSILSFKVSKECFPPVNFEERSIENET